MTPLASQTGPQGLPGAACRGIAVLRPEEELMSWHENVQTPNPRLMAGPFRAKNNPVAGRGREPSHRERWVAARFYALPTSWTHRDRSAEQCLVSQNRAKPPQTPRGGFKKTLTRWAAITERRFPIGLERSQVVAFKPVTKPALRLLESALPKAPTPSIWAFLPFFKRLILGHSESPCDKGRRQRSLWLILGQRGLRLGLGLWLRTPR